VSQDRFSDVGLMTKERDETEKTNSDEITGEYMHGKVLF